MLQIAVVRAEVKEDVGDLRQILSKRREPNKKKKKGSRLPNPTYYHGQRFERDTLCSLHHCVLKCVS